MPHKEAELNLQLALSGLIHEGPRSYGGTVILNLSPILFFPPPSGERNTETRGGVEGGAAEALKESQLVIFLFFIFLCVCKYCDVLERTLYSRINQHMHHIILTRLLFPSQYSLSIILHTHTHTHLSLYTDVCLFDLVVVAYRHTLTSQHCEVVNIL